MQLQVFIIMPLNLYEYYHDSILPNGTRTYIDKWSHHMHSCHRKTTKISTLRCSPPFHAQYFLIDYSRRYCKQCKHLNSVLSNAYSNGNNNIVFFEIHFLLLITTFVISSPLISAIMILRIDTISILLAFISSSLCKPIAKDFVLEGKWLFKFINPTPLTGWPVGLINHPSSVFSDQWQEY